MDRELFAWKRSQDTISYKLLINGKIVDMRLKIYNREVYTNRILLEGYIQNTSEIVWKAERSKSTKISVSCQYES